MDVIQYKIQDFEGHLEQIFRGVTLYRTAEYMRKHMPEAYSRSAPEEKTVPKTAL